MHSVQWVCKLTHIGLLQAEGVEMRDKMAEVVSAKEDCEVQVLELKQELVHQAKRCLV